ncbi:signal recognition particle 14 kDa protein isoform X2 [Arachis duranensis]|uniref:Signal recognition particle 14 kDa protein n=1 Tax=Arachis duranensis TaxID=130453 RepID=A0A6P5NP49_ARADU|nr:signal recognition particle 14 kDa protein isoform X2 [Arachis duranensis]XP_025618601.1 signal recognition particle 14 kDa protein isoform X2 [Arachis hypogaea]XP_057735085.1 signal recognition particle 14 kDa protein-like isoform X2 [Arachis stenosperma]
MNSPPCSSAAPRRALFGLHLNDVSSLKSKAVRNKMAAAGEAIDYKCLIRATNGKKTISTSVGTKDHQRFQASYATILKAHMTALKKRERKDKKKSAEADKREGTSKRPKKS